MKRNDPFIAVILGILSLASLITGWYGAAVAFGILFLLYLGEGRKKTGTDTAAPENKSEALRGDGRTVSVTVTENDGTPAAEDTVYEPEYTVIGRK